jgi:exopolyphosphatase/guanosine-5'-triphosphate,3'-diphosphate pyrophosphatase
MVYAAMDIGSNTLRLLVADVVNGALRPLKYERVITRLGKGVKESGLMDKETCRLSIAALKGFAGIVSGFNVQNLRCVGTSALREARNSSDFISDAKETAGLEIEVISGEKEAALTELGVLSGFNKTGPVVIVDMGGGSTELIYTDAGGKTGHITEPIGVVKLLEDHIKSDPPSEPELQAVRREADRVFSDLKGMLQNATGSKASLIGTAGTASTLAAIDLGLERYDPDRIHGNKIGLQTLLGLLAMLKDLPLGERAKVRGLEPGRADLIIPGIILTISLMETLGFDHITISERGLLEGIVLDMAGEGAK